MSSTQGAPRSFLTRKLIVNLIIVVVFLFSLGAVVYWISSGEAEKRIGRSRMLEELKKEQRAGKEKIPVGYDVTPLVDEEYFSAIQVDIERAKKSVEVLMFEIKRGKREGNPVNVLLRSLAAARQRGLEIRVRLEQSDLDPALTRTNRQAAEFLRGQGIYPEFDLPNVETHAKVVLIDGRILYIGNHNWSESALSRNKEISVRVESAAAITAMRRYFDRFDHTLSSARTSG